MKPRQPRLSPWQRLAVAQLNAVAVTLADDFGIMGAPVLGVDGQILVRVRLRTGHLRRLPGGLRLREQEEFLLGIGTTHLLPPVVDVDHDRFVGFPHVLQGQRVCIYLDPAREWDPQRGVGGALDRLYDWLRQATAAEFDAEQSLFHAVGGVLHRTRGAPTVVVRQPGRAVKAHVGVLVERSAHRYDLTFPAASAAGQNGARVVLFSTDRPLPVGAGMTVGEVLAVLDMTFRPAVFVNSDVGLRGSSQAPALMTALAAAASRQAEGSPQVFVLAVPHPVGGLPHLLAGRVSADAADELRRHVRDPTRGSLVMRPDMLDPQTPVEWLTVSDERTGVTTRRDDSRPTSAFRGKTVQVWGCGGIGSWIAEFIARAGAHRLILCDPGVVTGGLLVRQDFTEADIGVNKAEALRRRLVAISDDIQVEAHVGVVPTDSAALLDDTDVIIDATISRAVGQELDRVAVLPGRPMLAQVAVDSASSTLGLLSVSDPASGNGPNTVDTIAGETVLADGALEPFHLFWQDVDPATELIPTRGCSVPTFHGSAADLAAVAATLTSILGTHLGSEAAVSGTHLVSLAHSPAGPRHEFIPAS